MIFTRDDDLHRAIIMSGYAVTRYPGINIVREPYVTTKEVK